MSNAYELLRIITDSIDEESMPLAACIASALFNTRGELELGYSLAGVSAEQATELAEVFWEMLTNHRGWTADTQPLVSEAMKRIAYHVHTPTVQEQSANEVYPPVAASPSLAQLAQGIRTNTSVPSGPLNWATIANNIVAPEPRRYTVQDVWTLAYVVGQRMITLGEVEEALIRAFRAAYGLDANSELVLADALARALSALTWGEASGLLRLARGTWRQILIRNRAESSAIQHNLRLMGLER